MRRRKPAFAALGRRCGKGDDFFMPGKRRAHGRLPRDPAKALNDECDWSEVKVKVSHRLAMHLRVDRFQLRMPHRWSAHLRRLPKSAVTTGADLLEAHGARGTF